MSTLDYKTFYQRKLPHFQPTGKAFFVTFRLAGSIPQSVLDRWEAETRARQKHPLADAKRNAGLSDLAFQRKRFIEYEELLHQVVCGPVWLKDPRVALQVGDSLMHIDGNKYILDAYSIMPNHVHVVFCPLHNEEIQGEDHSLASIMHSLKSFTGQKANSILNRTGGFWQHENFDRAIRHEREWARTVAYVLNNPVKAGLVQRWKDWKYSYCRFDFE